MIRYLIGRLLVSGLVLVLLVTFVVLLGSLAPGDPASTLLGPLASPRLVELVRAEMRLDLPLHRQVLEYLAGAVQGDLGRDFFSRTPVTSIILPVVPHTAALAVATLGFAMIVGIPLGVLAGSRPESRLDRALSALSVSVISIPSFVVAILLMLTLGLRFRLFPIFGAGSFTEPLTYLRHLAMPAMALGLGWVGYLARLVRNGMLEAMASDYVRTARAFGLRRRTVLYRHALKNALVPTAAMLSMSLGSLLGGAVLVEVIFSRPGLGRLIVDAVSQRNFPVLQGGILIAGTAFLLVNLLADFLYRFLDPRIRIESAE
jgi:peptide/nickel transport system permease protein